MNKATIPNNKMLIQLIIFLGIVFENRVCIDRVLISKAGKFWSGNVNMTAMEYANWTDVAKIPDGKLVVRTVRTSRPKAIQLIKAKKE